MTILSERAVLIRPSISLWRGEITDRAASRDTAERANADARAVKTSKFLIARDAIDPIISAAGSLRTWVRTETLPWRWDGVSLLPTEAYFHFTQGWQERRMAFDGAVLKLLQNWDAHCLDGRTRLGTLGNQYEYPHKEQVAYQFSASLEVFPVPAAEDFRANISEAEADVIREELQNRADEQIVQAQTYLWEQMSECVSHIAERLNAYGKDKTSGKITGKFHDSLIGNLRLLVERLGRLNITKDPEIERMRKRLESGLCPYEPDDLRADEGLRVSVKDEAERIASDMQAIFSGKLLGKAA